MPYIPQHQLNFGAGIRYKGISANLNFLWKSQAADQAVAENRAFIPSYGVIDSAFAYQHDRLTKVFLNINNVLNQTYLVSYRPFGARVGAPRTFFSWFKSEFLMNLINKYINLFVEPSQRLFGLFHYWLF